MQLVVAGCDREIRQETLRFRMEVLSDALPKSLTFASDYRMRIYEADHMRSLLSKVPEFELLDVYDFWYDITDPLTLSDEMGDTVFVLQRK